STEVKTMKFDKKGFYSKALAYIENFATKNGYDLYLLILLIFTGRFRSNL
ncbi:unnamed protein product, partial [marine sediment metagenome]